ncbi:hypothetical protein [Aquimarina sp. 2201CG14-23]|uniref:hypothetical protein n=1 Tax=Aquimarina mycalae TaxID=3040073 RepID=UPI002477ED44|nr:hypothetical protein [Aquimarina sp. 2201CG14-23]MDH7445645.1 hypothetical protein [Aquimarina sp. 2201CG14-23]
MRYLCILFLSIILCSCSNDDNNNNRSTMLEGTWNLVNVTGGFAGINQDFERETIVWNFNESNNTVVVTNNSTITGVYDGFPTGTYSYSIVAPADTDELVVNEINLGTFTITSSSFTVSQQFRDGFQVQFER